MMEKKGLLSILSVLYLLGCQADRLIDTTFSNTTNLHDHAWFQYLQEVYGRSIDHKKVNASALEFFYKRSTVELVDNAPPSYLPYHAFISLFSIRKGYHGTLYPDNSWVEVTRISTRCFAYYHGFSDYVEGLSTTITYSIDFMPLLKKSYASAGTMNVKRPYGCWFFSTKGTGIYVNVGRTLAAKNRPELHRKLSIPCFEKLYCFPPGDALWCTRAIEEGYDSIQVPTIYGSVELVICTKRCAMEPVGETCPPVS